MAAYIEVTGGVAIFEKSLVGRLLNELCHYNEKEVYERLSQNALAYRMLRPLILLRTNAVFAFTDSVNPSLEPRITFSEFTSEIPIEGYPLSGIFNALS